MKLLGNAGQSTVEYAVVCAALGCIVAGLAALWRFFSDGGFAAMVLGSMSHRLPEGLLDVLGF